ncbi:MAG: hypothetical protein E4H28_02175 [Gemmatimonadales bacterium]|nr:MAG: hypothetical protein E4H28_02175 [Gemmatimonadales bacterium]
MSARDKSTQELLRSPKAGATEAAERDRAVRRIALFLHTSVRAVDGNLPGSLLTVLCRIPESTPLRRSQDHTIMNDVRLLFDEIEEDDQRLPRLKFLVEAASFRARM